MVSHVIQAQLIVLARKVHFTATTSPLLVTVPVRVIVLQRRHLGDARVITTVEDGVVIGQLAGPSDGDTRRHLTGGCVVGAGHFMVQIVVHGTVDGTCEANAVAVEDVVFGLGVGEGVVVESIPELLVGGLA